MGLNFKACFATGWVLLWSAGLFGQQDTLGQDSIPYKLTFPNKITFRMSVQNTGNSFNIKEVLPGQNLLLKPGAQNYLGLSVLFRSLEVDLGFAPSFLNKAHEEADPRLFNLNMRMFFGPWMQSLDFYSQNGFYYDLDDSRGYLPELRTLKIGGTTSYIFNPNFSFRAIGFQNEWQRRSAGSFIPTFLYYYTRYRVQGEDTKTVSHTYNFAVGPGYYYNWVVRENFIFSLGNSTGLGINIFQEDSGTVSSLLFESVFRTALGYNSERFFTGINVSLTYLNHANGPESRLDDRIHFIEGYVGFRLDAPEKWLRAAERFNRRMGWD